MFAFLLPAALMVAQEQSFPGIRTGNYQGVLGTLSNPANIAGGKYAFDINLFSLNAGLSNDNTSYQLKKIKDLFSGTSVDSLFFNGKKSNINGLVNIDLMLPSFMFSIGPKNSFAITTRARVITNVNRFDTEITNAISDAENGTTVYPYSFNDLYSQGFTLNAWGEVGVTYGRVIFNTGKHLLKAGITAKYLTGVANSYLEISDMHGKIVKDSQDKKYLTAADGSQAATGTIIFRQGGIDVDKLTGDNSESLKVSDFINSKNHGFGGDLGVVYEFKPNESSKYYLFRAGVSLNDFGSIKYRAHPKYSKNFEMNIPTGQQFSMSQFDGKSFSESQDMIENSSYFDSKADSSSYKVSLPTTLQFDFDYHVASVFYVDLGAQIAMTSDKKFQNPYFVNYYSVTPRLEGKRYGIYLPLSYNEMTHFNAGLSLKLGPLFVGSGSILGALVDKSKQVDVHAGLRFGILRGNKKSEVKQEKEPEMPEVKEELPPATTNADANSIKDSDGDGITDDVDKCPNQPGVAKYNGCPVPDSDGDGIDDDHDQCPDKPGVAKYNGCPVPDSDGDGIDDEHDQCPDKPGVERYNGCPVPDTDGDGIDDEHDKCPDQPGVAKYNGCPIPDTDGDGVNDELDKCPTIPGTAENNGCPAVKLELVKKANVAAKQIQFVTGKATLLPVSKTKLMTIVKILSDDKDLKLYVAGHTDNVGNPQKNQKLSEDRAAAVRNFFVSKGIAGERIFSQGFGDTKPVASNKQPAGRKLNRRVELKFEY